MKKQLFLIIVLFAIFSTANPIAALSPKKQAQAEAYLAQGNRFLAEAKRLYQEKGEGGFFGGEYQGPFNQAKEKFKKAKEIVAPEVKRRKVLSATIDRLALQKISERRIRLEEQVLLELTLLPQTFYRQMLTGYFDIAKNANMFLPPLIILPQKDLRYYKKIPSEAAKLVPALAEDVGFVPPGERLPNFLEEKPISYSEFFDLLESSQARKEFFRTQKTIIATKIATLKASREVEPDAALYQYQLGSAYLLDHYYTKLQKGFRAYQEAQDITKNLLRTPTEKSLTAFRSQYAALEFPLYDNVKIKNIDTTLKKDAEAHTLCAKITLPADLPEKDFEEDLIKQIKAKIDSERNRLYKDFKEITEKIYYLSLYDPPQRIMEHFEKVVELEPINATYRIRLGHLYRSKALATLVRIKQVRSAYKVYSTLTQTLVIDHVSTDENVPPDLKEVIALLGKAKYQYDFALRLIPQEAAPHRTLGTYYMSVGQVDPAYFNKAGEKLSKAIDILPSEVNIFASEHFYFLTAQEKDAAKIIEFSRRIVTHPSPGPLASASPSLVGEAAIIKTAAKLLPSPEHSKDLYQNLDKDLSLAQSHDLLSPSLPLARGHLAFWAGTTLPLTESIPKKQVYFLYLPEEKNPQRNIKNSLSPQTAKKYDVQALEKAITFYKEVTARYPNFAAPHFYLGKTYTTLSRFWQAEEDREKVIETESLGRKEFIDFLKLIE